MAQTEQIAFLASEDCKLNDGCKLYFGTATSPDVPSSGDISFEWDGTDFDILQLTANSSFKWGVDGAGMDQVWYGDTASANMTWDQSADDLIFSGAAGLVMNGTAGIKFGDDVVLSLGASADFALVWSTTGTDHAEINPLADDYLLTFGLAATPQLSWDLQWFANEAAGASFLYFDASANLIYTTGVDLQFLDNDYVVFGTGAGASGDVQIRWDGTDLDVTCTADSVLKFGNGTTNFDIWFYGNTANNYLLWDESANALCLAGAVHPVGLNALSTRYELRWVAGARGKPGVNGDIQNAAEATRMIADPDIEVLGTNASSDDVTFYAEGGITLETDGADHDQVILLPHLDASQSAWTQVTWGTDQETTWECWIRTGAAVDTSTVIWAGLKLTMTEVTATDADQVFFRYQDTVNDGEWQAVSSIGGADDAHDTNVVVAINTDYHLKIVILADRTAKMFINDVLVETTGALTNAIDLIPYIGIQSEGVAAARSMAVRGQAISRKFA